MSLNFSTRDSEVAEVLAEFPAIFVAGRAEPLTSHGGLSGARLWRVETVDAAFALRQWPAEHPSADRLRFIHAVLAHVYARGLTIVPVPVKTCGGETIVAREGRLWELAPWLPGEPSFEREPNRAKIAAAMRSLANFHLASASFSWGGWGRGEAKPPAAPSPGLIDRSQRLAGLDDSRFADLRHAVEHCTVNTACDTLAREILAYLPRAVAIARSRLTPAVELVLALQPCLRDIWHGNLLFSGDDVTGIVDFGAMQIDSPALDVARLLGSMAGDDPELWRQGLASYCEFRPLTADEHVAVSAADASGIALGCVNWLRWLYVEKRQFSDLSAVEIRIKSLAPAFSIWPPDQRLLPLPTFAKSDKMALRGW